MREGWLRMGWQAVDRLGGMGGRQVAKFRTSSGVRGTCPFLPPPATTRCRLGHSTTLILSSTVQSIADTVSAAALPGREADLTAPVIAICFSPTVSAAIALGPS